LVSYYVRTDTKKTGGYAPPPSNRRREEESKNNNEEEERDGQERESGWGGARWGWRPQGNLPLDGSERKDLSNTSRGIKQFF